ncbi:class I SAM-dependent methyltransferase [Rummeliibacillus pycnus]|uniref:class I SAM-dependent methyltransferase n=1 Tax=Rummeliibacillus pycnus TaxID=101070 RepID=UPI003D27A33C
MKYRESGMPNEEIWEEFFNPQQILQSLEVTNDIKKFIDIGCGYGTFLIPASKIISGVAIGVDIDKDYLTLCKQRGEDNNIANIHLFNGDISNFDNNTMSMFQDADYITMFNILHCEEPLKLIGQSIKLLKKGGKIGVIHWIYEDTPRGPSLDIRPKPEDIIKWGKYSGLKLIKQVQLPPYHFGILFEK